jgi:predicted negative regulator of RcsB-dependent stress response
MAILARVFAWFLTPTGTWIAGAVVLFGAWQGNNYYQRQKGASSALVRVEKATEAINEKARKARDAAGGPGAADRLRQGYCRDC